jgi:hypothetical protein
MVNSVLPTFFMSNIKLPPTIINMLEKYRKHYFWIGSDLNDKKPPLAVWKLATRPKNEGDWEFLSFRLRMMHCY